MACAGCAARRAKIAAFVRGIIPSRKLTPAEVAAEFGPEAAARMKIAESKNDA